MSLLSLLTVGNSFTSAEDHPSRYRMSRQKLLPHFGVSQNLEPDGDSGAQQQPGTAVAALVAAPELFRAEASLPALPARAPEHPRHDGGEPGGKANRTGPWAIRRPFGLGRTLPLRAPAAPEQQDLPWREITVARNDLSEADVVIVPAPRNSSAWPVGPLSLPARTRRLWSRLRERFGGRARSATVVCHER